MTFGDFTLTSVGDDDIFILRMSHSGDVLWAIRAGGIYEDNVVGLVGDDDGTIYLSGFCSENAHFGSTYLPGYGGADAFICRVSEDGEFIWTISGGGSSNDRAYRLSLSDQGDFLAFSGHYADIAQFGQNHLPSWGGRDAFFARVDTAGSFTWVFPSGSDSDESGYGVDIDTDGSIYCAGYFFSNSWPIGPYTISNSASGSADCALIKLTSNGGVVYAKSFGGNYEDLPRPLAVHQGFIYIGGYHYGPGDYLGIPVNAPIQYKNSYVLKCDLLGNGIWALDGLSYYDDELIGLSMTTDNHLVISGGFQGSIQVGSQSFTSLGEYDAYLVSLDISTGIPITAIKGGGQGNDVFFGTDSYSDKVLVAGFFETTAFFDTVTLLSAGMKDIVIGRVDDFGIGIRELSERVVTLYPNPCNDWFTIEFPGVSITPCSVSISNIKGQLIETVSSLLDQKQRLDVSAYPPGVYMVKVYDGINVPVLKKLVVY